MAPQSGGFAVSPSREREVSALQTRSSPTEWYVPGIPSPRGCPLCPATFPGVHLCNPAKSFLSLTPSPGCCLPRQGLSSKETSSKMLSWWGSPRELACQVPLQGTDNGKDTVLTSPVY